MNNNLQSVATDIFNASEARRQLVEQINNNSGKRATVGYTHETKGTGAVLVQQPVMFGCQFLDEPGVTTGLILPKGQRIKSVKHDTSQGPILSTGPKPGSAVFADNNGSPAHGFDSTSGEVQYDPNYDQHTFAGTLAVGDITYDATTHRFTINKAGYYSVAIFAQVNGLQAGQGSTMRVKNSLGNIWPDDSKVGYGVGESAGGAQATHNITLPHTYYAAGSYVQQHFFLDRWTAAMDGHRANIAYAEVAFFYRPDTNSITALSSSSATSTATYNTAKAAGTLTNEQRQQALPAKDAVPDKHGVLKVDDIDFPVVQTGVYDFVIDDNTGLYTGAYVFVVVFSGNYTLHHHFEFSGVALKQLNSQVLETL